MIVDSGAGFLNFMLIVAIQNCVQVVAAGFTNEFVFGDIAQIGFIGGGELVSAHGTYCHGKFPPWDVMDGEVGCAHMNNGLKPSIYRHISNVKGNC